MSPRRDTNPGYEWECQRCRASNPPGIGNCRVCHFPARFTAAQLNGVPAMSTRENILGFAGVCAVLGACVLFYGGAPDWMWELGPKPVLALAVALLFAGAWLIKLARKLAKRLISS
jgi:hypothetical protein